MDTKQLLEEMRDRHLHMAKEMERVRDWNEKGTPEYSFREGQINTMLVEAGWCEDMLEILHSDNVE